MLRAAGHRAASADRGPSHLRSPIFISCHPPALWLRIHARGVSQAGCRGAKSRRRSHSSTSYIALGSNQGQGLLDNTGTDRWVTAQFTHVV